jgi:hypothetical protein
MATDRQVRRGENACPGSAFARPSTRVDLTWIAGRVEHYVRFGRVAAAEATGSCTRTVAFRPGANFAVVRRTASDLGAVHSSILIATAAAAGQPDAALPFVRPGCHPLLRLDGCAMVQQVLEAIGAVETAGLDPCDVSPDHWRHVEQRIAAGLAVRPYGADRHAAWLRRRAIEA